VHATVFLKSVDSFGNIHLKVAASGTFYSDHDGSTCLVSSAHSPDSLFRIICLNYQEICLRMHLALLFSSLDFFVIFGLSFVLTEHVVVLSDLLRLWRAIVLLLGVVELWTCSLLGVVVLIRHFIYINSSLWGFGVLGSPKPQNP